MGFGFVIWVGMGIFIFFLVSLGFMGFEICLIKRIFFKRKNLKL